MLWLTQRSLIPVVLLMAFGSIFYFLTILSAPDGLNVKELQPRFTTSRITYLNNNSSDAPGTAPIIKQWARTHNNNNNNNGTIATTTITDNNANDFVIDQFPGSFANHMLYLQGIRLTTSYEESNNDVHVDLFGFQGDAIHSRDNYNRCRGIPREVRRNILSNAQIGQHILLFCQLATTETTTYTNPEEGNHNNNNLMMIPALFVPINSIDLTQNQATTIWRCNVTDQLNRQQLRDKAAAASSSFETVHFYMKFINDTTTTPSSSSTTALTRIATFQIPLDTGVAGMGGPHIRGGPYKSYFHQPPVAAGLCVAIYGKASLQYLPEFIQHHLNVGFDSIVIGVRGNPDNAELKEAQQLVQMYIDQGVVSLAHYGAPFRCSDDFSKVPFYRDCLYHHKGLTQFSATWDLDEFWIPPRVLQVDGKHNYWHNKRWWNGKERIVNDNTSIPTSDARITMSNWSTFPVSVRKDPLWQNSMYARSVSIVDTMRAIEQYYIQHDCADAWCFHLFPSQRVHLKGNGAINRTGFIGNDFEMRNFIHDNYRQKSFANTKYAHLVGFHFAGACYFDGHVNASLPFQEQNQLFHALARPTSDCAPRHFDTEVYGGVHHFWELHGVRSYDRNPRDVSIRITLDEYVSLYAPTVKRQLLERKLINATIL